jgi:amiloride-sensitive sodium channel
MACFTAICRNKSLLIKIFKFFGYLLLLIGLGYQTQRLYKKLKVEPEIFSKESSIQSSQVPFPAVTFCPPVTVKNEAWSSEFLRQHNISINDLRGAYLQTCPNHDIDMHYQRSDANFVEVMLKTTPNIAETIYTCGINRYWMNLQDCDKLFVRSITEYGICFTFNMLGHNSVFNPGTSSDFDTFKRTRITKIWDKEHVLNESRHEDDTEAPIWSLEAGYLSDSSYVQPAKALRRQEFLIGLTGTTNESFCEYHEKNYKIFLHLPNELPQDTYDTIAIPLGVDDNILISADMTHYEESLRGFPPDKRGCYFEGEKPLKIFKSYTKANCEYECMTNFVNSSCGCVKFSMPRTKDMKVCDYFHYSCIASITDIFPRSYYENHENMKKFPDYPCGCLPSCHEIKYKVIKNDRKNKESE